MAKVTVTLPHFDPRTPPPAPVEHDGATGFAWVGHEAGHTLEVYASDGPVVAVYAPGCWASAAVS
ncbi:hypothetical protein ACJ5H2_13470 [Nocardioides sp. R1-1]|uniref:hypothetical protein n=1 Tax=Nocardioides sp. R1-1 TaxID=3383502 RepID=UPI0038D2450A